MHPIFRRPARLLVYLLAAAAWGALLAGLLEARSPGPLGDALAIALPLAIVFAFQCLATWYAARALPVATTPLARLIATHVVFGISSVSLWLLLGGLWAGALAALDERTGPAERFAGGIALLAVFGLVVHALAVVAHYLLIALESSRDAQRHALESQLAARDAELRSLRAQLSPHFLFNSLNSISALAGTDPAAARRMCLLLSGFFRKSIALGARTVIPLDEELDLALTYLSIEEVRFGRRLRVAAEIEAGAREITVPPLLLQPLVENAIHHGIAHLVAGGEVRLEARRRDGFLVLSVENPCDPDRPDSRGTGTGLSNVRSRVEALHGAAAGVQITEGPGYFRVELSLPAAVPAD